MADLFDGLDNTPAPNDARCGELERWAYSRGFVSVVGLDEAGRGPLAGPVVAAAVALPHPCLIEGINDSKLLNEARREALFQPIQEHALAWAIASCSPAEIDEHNILQASLIAMARAFQQLTLDREAVQSVLVVTDGNNRAPLPPEVDQRPLVKGDQRSLNIAAASILAKVTRDRVMQQFDAQWPQYGFAQHKGYPTAAHQEALLNHGPCPIHRRSFNLSGRRR